MRGAPACRDLISSADTIVDMAHTCDGVLGNIKGVQVRTAGFETSFVQ